MWGRMKKIHWAGGIKHNGNTREKNWPACCVGALAYRIKYHGLMNHSQPLAVTCVRCRMLLVKAGLLEVSDA